MKQVLGILFLIASQWSVALGAAAFCADTPCSMNLGRRCSEALQLQLLYGTCCSLSDVADNPNDCLLTVAGDNVVCNMRQPNYQCIPEQGCLPEWDMVEALTPGYTCPPSSYVVPTVQPQDTPPATASPTPDKKGRGKKLGHGKYVHG
jgi:hypothetical protein